MPLPWTCCEALPFDECGPPLKVFFCLDWVHKRCSMLLPLLAHHHHLGPTSVALSLGCTIATLSLCVSLSPSRTQHLKPRNLLRDWEISASRYSLLDCTAVWAVSRPLPPFGQFTQRFKQFIYIYIYMMICQYYC